MPQQDDRNILDVLKSELYFLEKGGYGRSPREPWRVPQIFEDSPSCMNYDSKENPSPCNECALMEFVPPERRGDRFPCRHIPITSQGNTVQEIFHGGTQQDLEEALGVWLHGTIARLEAEQEPKTPATASGA